MSERVSTSARHETVDVTPRAITYLLVGIGITLLLLGVLVLVLFPDPLQDRTLTLPLPSYPNPRLQASPAAELQLFRTHEQQQLNSLAWRDHAANTVHLPIEDAMRKIVEQGIPDWPKTPVPSR